MYTVLENILSDFGNNTNVHRNTSVLYILYSIILSISPHSNRNVCFRIAIGEKTQTVHLVESGNRR